MVEEKKDFSTAILEKKKAPNKLQVEDSTQDDNSIIELTQAKMDELKIFKGDAVMLRGKKRKETICIALNNEAADAKDNQILMNKVVRRNLRVRIGDICSIHPITNDVPNLGKVHVLPFSDSIEGITGNLTETYLIPYFKDCYRPVKKNDTFMVRGAFRAVEFKVVDVDPGEYGIVAPTTTLFDEGEPINRDDENDAEEVGYDDIGGCRKQMAKIREMIELPLRHP